MMWYSKQGYDLIWNNSPFTSIQIVQATGTSVVEMFNLAGQLVHMKCKTYEY
jgi:hypothetical protein